MKRLFFYSIAISLFISCKKETDTVLPDITITTPSAGSNCTMPCTIHVSGDVTDNSALSSLTLAITDPDHYTVSSCQLSLSGTSQHYSQDFYVNDVHLNSGTYQIFAQVTDAAGNNRSAYQDISVTGYSRILEAALVATGHANAYNVFKINGTSLSPIISTSSGFNGITTNDWNQQIIVAPDDYTAATVNAWYGGAIDSQNSFSISNTSGNGYFTGTFYGAYSHGFWITFNNGTTRRITNGLVFDRSIQQQNGYTASCLAECQSKLLTFEVANGTVNHLCAYTISTGLQTHDQVINFEVVNIFPVATNPNQARIWGNQNGQGVLYETELINYPLSQQTGMPAGKIYEVASVDDTRYLLAHDQGLIMFSTNSGFTTISPTPVHHVQFDAVNQVAYTGINNTIEVFDLNGNSFGQITAPDTIRAIRLLFNK